MQLTRTNINNIANTFCYEIQNDSSNINNTANTKNEATGDGDGKDETYVSSIQQLESWNC